MLVRNPWVILVRSDNALSLSGKPETPKYLVFIVDPHAIIRPPLNQN